MAYPWLTGGLLDVSGWLGLGLFLVRVLLLKGSLSACRKQSSIFSEPTSASPTIGCHCLRVGKASIYMKFQEMGVHIVPYFGFLGMFVREGRSTQSFGSYYCSKFL
ncbi:hypothetical protein ACQKWADRAFT_301327 [Trichoderma austrokoningii]